MSFHSFVIPDGSPRNSQSKTACRLNDGGGTVLNMMVTRRSGTNQLKHFLQFFHSIHEEEKMHSVAICISTHRPLAPPIPVARLLSFRLDFLVCLMMTLNLWPILSAYMTRLRIWWRQSWRNNAFYRTYPKGAINMRGGIRRYQLAIQLVRRFAADLPYLKPVE